MEYNSRNLFKCPFLIIYLLISINQIPSCIFICSNFYQISDILDYALFGIKSYYFKIFIRILKVHYGTQLVYLEMVLSF